MKLVPVIVKGIYGKPGSLLPVKMAKMTPDAAAALAAVQKEIESLGGCFRLSDCYRSSAMQAQAHKDWKTGKKKAYSPPAGGSMHEAGRAIDLDLAALIHAPSVPKGSETISELTVRAIFEKHDWTFIAPAGNPHQVDVKESWHIEFRGPFQKVYDSVRKKSGVGTAAYQAMVREAIADLANDNYVPDVDEPEEIVEEPAEQPAVSTPEPVVTQPTQPAAPVEQPAPSVEQPAAPAAAAASTASPTVGEKLKSSSTFVQSLGIQVGALGAAIWTFFQQNGQWMGYILGGVAVVSLCAYGIYCWKEVQTKKIEAMKK